MDEMITLRPHHLTEIYDIFVAVLSCDMFEPSKEYINNLIADKIGFLNSNTNYPKETIKKLHSILSKFFFDDAVIVFKKGPDDICNAGCLSFKKILELCENKNAREDVVVTEIFGIEMKEYKKEELWFKMTKVFQERGEIQWL